MVFVGKICIAEVEELVKPGDISPDDIHLPGIYVNRIVKGESYEKRIEWLMLAGDADNCLPEDKKCHIRHRIGRRVAKEFKDGMYINLGIGIPTVASNYIPEGLHVELMSENGLLGMFHQIRVWVCA